MEYVSAARPTHLLQVVEVEVDRVTRRVGGAGWRPAHRHCRLDPVPYSVHAIDDDTGLPACACATSDELTRFDHPWEALLPVFKCRSCHELVPVPERA